MSKAWLITGASRGLGRAFTEAILESGDRVVSTARNPEQLVELQGRYSGKIRTVTLDVTNEAQAKAAFELKLNRIPMRIALYRHCRAELCEETTCEWVFTVD